MKKFKQLMIIGVKANGKVAAEAALKMNRWERIAFLEDDPSISSCMGIRIVDRIDEVFKYINDYEILVALGDNKIRAQLHEEMKKAGAVIPKVVHPAAVIGEMVEIGRGTVVMAGAIINCSSRIGEGCMICSGASIDHDNLIEDYVHIAPGVHTAGTVTIGKHSWVGIGSVISNNISIASDSTIGAGAVVLKNIIEAGIYAGVPARKIK